MIEFKVRFWTNNIAKGKGKIRPKHLWGAGVVSIRQNASHGIAPGKPKVFHTLAELTTAIEKVMAKNGLTLHPSREMRKYMQDKT